MRLPLIHVDAFPERPFAGNPAAVCLLDGPREPGWMQALAAELNLPETAFVAAHADGFGLRWFTPTISRRRSRWTCAATRRWPPRTRSGRSAGWLGTPSRDSTRAAA